MKIELAKGQKAPQEAILALEAGLGARLSESFRSFVDVQDGAEPSNNVFRLRDNDSAGVNEFIPVIGSLRLERPEPYDCVLRPSRNINA